MKTTRYLLLVASVLLVLAAPAEARGRRGSAGGEPRARGLQLSNGLQLSSGLQMSGPLNGSGPAPVAARLTEDEWRKAFPRKEPAK